MGMPVLPEEIRDTVTYTVPTPRDAIQFQSNAASSQGAIEGKPELLWG